MVCLSPRPAPQAHRHRAVCESQCAVLPRLARDEGWWRRAGVLSAAPRLRLRAPHRVSAAWMSNKLYRWRIQQGDKRGPPSWASSQQRRGVVAASRMKADLTMDVATTLAMLCGDDEDEDEMTEHDAEAGHGAEATEGKLAGDEATASAPEAQQRRCHESERSLLD